MRHPLPVPCWLFAACLAVACASSSDPTGGPGAPATGSGARAGDDGAGADLDARQAGAPVDAGPSDEIAVPGAAPVVIVDPDYILFSYVTPMEEALYESFRVSNAGDADLVVTGLRLEGSNANYAFLAPPPLPLTLPPGEHQDITLRFAAFDPGISNVVLTTNDAARPEAAVKLAGQEKLRLAPAPIPQIPESACATIDPGELEFGALPRGEVRDESLNVRNCDLEGRDLLVHYAYVTDHHSASISQPTFEIEPAFPLPVVIPPGESIPLGVRFTPREVGAHEGSVVLGGTWPAKAAYLRGTAIEPPVHTQAVKVRLTWDREATDVDSHLLAPGGAIWHQHTDCWFANRAPDWGTESDMTDDPFLDLDDVDGLGPEHINIEAPGEGAFRFLAHYYSAGASGDVVSNVTVEVFHYGVSVATFGPEPLGEVGEVWEVFEMAMDGDAIEITALGEHYVSDAPW